MMARTKIEWTESTWNPITGCDPYSDGCKNCYAKRMAKRLKAMNNPRYRNEFKVTIHSDLFNKPKEWKKSQMIFVNSMSDIFHENISEEVIFALFKVMSECKQHIFQVLTKRAKRMNEILAKIDITDNIWIGVTVESADYIERIDYLRNVNVKTKFISFEPLLSGFSNLNLKDIQWAIVGGESGPKSRPIEKEWIFNIKDTCEKFGTLFYFKQWGGTNKKKSGKLLNGKEYLEMPEVNIV